MRLIYYPTHTRMGAWLIGVICGYFLHIYKDTKIILSKIVITTGWIISLGIILAIIFGQYNIQQFGHINNEIEDAFYDSCSRVGWAIAISWIIFACVQGYGGCINWFLSLKEWQPLGRLSYCMYLTHLVIQVNLMSEVRTSSYFSDISAVHSLWGDFGYTLTISTVWCLFFESPIIVIEKVLFNKFNLIKIQHTLGNDSETISVQPEEEDLTIHVSSTENLIMPEDLSETLEENPVQSRIGSTETSTSVENDSETITVEPENDLTILVNSNDNALETLEDNAVQSR